MLSRPFDVRLPAFSYLILLDSYWKVYLAKDVITNQEYDVRVATFDEGDVRSLNRLKQEIALWVY